MSDMDTDQSVPSLPAPSVVPPVDPAPSAVPRRRSVSWGWLLWIIALAGVGYVYWRLQNVEQGQDRVAQDGQATVQKLRVQTDALQREAGTNRHDVDALRARLDDAAKVNESLRAQVLGLSERARLAEDAIANLADKRLSGHDSLLLNEAELLLVLGGERYRLFHDPASAIGAYRLADAALVEANNAAFSTIRQSINAELSALGNLQSVNTTSIADQLGQARARLAQLPLPTNEEKPGTAPTSRWEQVFGEFVRVSREADTREMLARSDPMLARALVDANLRDAQAALLLRDGVQFKRALAAARTQLASSFDAKAASVEREIADIDALAKVELAPPTPDVLGAALKELRNLRTTQALRPAEPPPPAAPASPAPAVSVDKT